MHGFQNKLCAQWIEVDFDNKPNTITVAPLNLFDFINPSLQLGYERMLNKKITFQVEGGLILNHDIRNYLVDNIRGFKDCPFTNSGFKIRGEFKYFYSERKLIKPYVSYEIFYTKNRSGVQDLFLIADTTFIYSKPRPVGANTYYDFFMNDKQRFGINLKFGLKYLIGKNLLLEPHIGIGVVLRKSNHYDRENINDKLYDEVSSINNKAGIIWLPNLPFNIKIGYRF